MAPARRAARSSIQPELQNLSFTVMKRREGNSKLRLNSRRRTSRLRNSSTRLTPPHRTSTKRLEVSTSLAANRSHVAPLRYLLVRETDLYLGRQPFFFFSAAARFAS